jgi:hypothetical protein
MKNEKGVIVIFLLTGERPTSQDTDCDPRTRATTSSYRDGWDRVFSAPKPECKSQAN